jgi:hypothetical protein
MNIELTIGKKEVEETLSLQNAMAILIGEPSKAKSFRHVLGFGGPRRSAGGRLARFLLSSPS